MNDRKLYSNHYFQKKLIECVGGTENWTWDFAVAQWCSANNINYDIIDIREWSSDLGLPIDPSMWNDEHKTLFQLTWG